MYIDTMQHDGGSYITLHGSRGNKARLKWSQFVFIHTI
jgi:hypothetical protein